MLWPIHFWAEQFTLDYGPCRASCFVKSKQSMDDGSVRQSGVVLSALNVEQWVRFVDGARQHWNTDSECGPKYDVRLVRLSATLPMVFKLDYHLTPPVKSISSSISSLTQPSLLAGTFSRSRCCYLDASPQCPASTSRRVRTRAARVDEWTRPQQALAL